MTRYIRARAGLKRMLIPTVNREERHSGLPIRVIPASPLDEVIALPKAKAGVVRAPAFPVLFTSAAGLAKAPP